MVISLKQIGTQAGRRLAELASREPFFFIIAVCTIALSFFSRPHFSAVHWDVIATLFSLMLVCQGFERCGLLGSLAGAAAGMFRTQRALGASLIAATGLLAMFVTNDVSLFTVVPLTIAIASAGGEDPFLLIILETASANVFSALTPFGNPQNLYLYSCFHISPAGFFRATLPLCLFGGTLLFGINAVWNRGGMHCTEKPEFEISDRILLFGSGAAFLLNTLSVLRVLDFRAALAATAILFLLCAPRLFFKVDYFLLLTFVLFFLFTSSITGIPAVRAFFSGALRSGTAVLFYSAGLSQVLSNVPAAVLLSGFTSHWRELLCGVSAGGLGTPVASLASVISYKLYVRRYPSGGRYLKVFSAVNFSVLLLTLAALWALGRFAPGW